MESKNGRPKLKLPISRFERILTILSIIVVTVTWIYLLVIWSKLPNVIVTHFGAAGKADGWGGKSSIIMLPVVQSFLFLLIIVGSKFPYYFNYPINITEENAEKQYKNARVMMLVMTLEISILFLYIEWRGIEVALGRSTSLGIWFLPVVLLSIFGTIGYYIYKVFKLK